MLRYGYSDDRTAIARTMSSIVVGDLAPTSDSEAAVIHTAQLQCIDG